MLIRYLAGPLIGSVIGYFTNYIAVKMLFYPRREIRIGGHRLPFTPGAIPKGKDRLGRAVGEVVSRTLITQADIENRLLSEEAMDKISDAIAQQMTVPIKQEIMELTAVSEESYIENREKFAAKMSLIIAETLSKMDFSELIVEKGSEIIKERLNNPMLMMFLSDEMLASILYPMGGELQKFLYLEGEELITPVMSEKLQEAEEKSVGEVMTRFDIREEQVTALIRSLCRKMLSGGIGPVMESLNLQGIVEAKINEMSVEELEQLVLTVMKKELNTIVNLGALIGFILGLLNIWL